jgi:hypothetical protein
VSKKPYLGDCREGVVKNLKRVVKNRSKKPKRGSKKLSKKPGVGPQLPLFALDGKAE